MCELILRRYEKIEKLNDMKCDSGSGSDRKCKDN